MKIKRTDAQNLSMAIKSFSAINPQTNVPTCKITAKASRIMGQNLSALKLVNEEIETVRSTLLKTNTEQLSTAILARNDLPSALGAFLDANQEWKSFLNAEADVEIAKVKWADLNCETNSICPEIYSWLAPMMED